MYGCCLEITFKDSSPIKENSVFNYAPSSLTGEIINEWRNKYRNGPFFHRSCKEWWLEISSFKCYQKEGLLKLHYSFVWGAVQSESLFFTEQIIFFSWPFNESADQVHKTSVNGLFTIWIDKVLEFSSLTKWCGLNEGHNLFIYFRVEKRPLINAYKLEICVNSVDCFYFCHFGDWHSYTVKISHYIWLHWYKYCDNVSGIMRSLCIF